MKMRAGVVAVLLVLLMTGVAFGQQAAVPMVREADPAFEVATIKPNDSGIQVMMGLGFRGRNFSTRNTSVGDLIGFAYGKNSKQIVGVPKEMERERYDINGVPDVEGVPNVRQQQTMVKKLLTERFKLTFHEDKREMAAFVMTVGKDGSKLVPTKLDGLNPVTGVRPSDDGWVLSSQNASMAIWAGVLQLVVLDRPVVDKTGLTGRYDVAVDFTPDNSQFNGHPPPPRTTQNPSPGLFDAMQQQLGLKLNAEKAMVDVVVVDSVTKPSEN
jgi:uncharacterized protein (TIGR03435 family)